jgi:hypothetical protein
MNVSPYQMRRAAFGPPFCFVARTLAGYKAIVAYAVARGAS